MDFKGTWSWSSPTQILLASVSFRKIFKIHVDSCSQPAMCLFWALFRPCCDGKPAVVGGPVWKACRVCTFFSLHVHNCRLFFWIAELFFPPAALGRLWASRCQRKSYWRVLFIPGDSGSASPTARSEWTEPWGRAHCWKDRGGDAWEPALR